MLPRAESGGRATLFTVPFRELYRPATVPVVELAPSLGLPATRAAARQWLGQRVVVPSDGVVVLGPSGTRSLAELEAVAERVRAIVADSVLWSWSSGQWSQLAGVVRRSGPSSPIRLLFLEPTAGLGWRDRVQRSNPRFWRRRYGHEFGRDIPAELRSHGLTVTTTVRFREGPVRHYVVGEARYYRHMDRSPPGPATG